MRIGEFRVALESGRLPLEMEVINRKRFSVLVGAIINGAKAGVFLNGRQPFPNSFSSVAPNHNEAFGITLGRCASQVNSGYHEITSLTGIVVSDGAEQKAIETFQIGPYNTDKFTKEPGLIGYTVADLDHLPVRPCAFFM